MQFSAGAHFIVRITADDVGRRVSVRTVTGPGEAGARFTDTVGVLTSWADGVLSVTRRDGRVVEIAEAAMVAAKAVPPAPARRRGLPSADVAELTAVGVRAWPAPETERFGDWIARAGGGWTRRANSAVAPGGPSAGAPDLPGLMDWYAERRLPAVLHLGPGHEALAADLDGRGWAAGGHAVLLVGPLAPLADRTPDERVVVSEELTDAWLAGWPRAAEAPDVARRVLAGGPRVFFGVVPGAAVGRCVVDGRWAGYAAVRVAPDHHRTGLATAVMAELARAALGAGASAAYLQVETDNAPARALYAALGFGEHHGYHYRTAPPGR
ncbi:N-acetyltransferase [Streptomyces sp. PT12]|uniref:GNAT family N-acetyltransferase n=1 Tax=Streptomyces sp. PT12 TaxID=1510197 RepID=UPI000DE53E13|nr:GNAT family N-acetyltransferase [Streptomyces sp. PT12]RBM11850.1 GNAT family N-acetyltransferase [Streptomyces sp. PT12]